MRHLRAVQKVEVAGPEFHARHLFHLRGDLLPMQRGAWVSEETEDAMNDQKPAQPCLTKCKPGIEGAHETFSAFSPLRAVIHAPDCPNAPGYIAPVSVPGSADQVWDQSWECGCPRQRPRQCSTHSNYQRGCPACALAEDEHRTSCRSYKPAPRRSAQGGGVRP